MGILGYEPLDSQLHGAGPGRAAPALPEGYENAPLIVEIAPDSLAAELEIEPGERIVSINGRPIGDGIDLLFESADEDLQILTLDATGKDLLQYDLTRDFGEELGIALEDFKIERCNNQCVFCFIHQNPKGLRKSLYYKDGDFRMSFLHGNYITTTNMTDADFDRIVAQRLSPMYVSVHTTNHELRLKMLGTSQSADILQSLDRFRSGGVEFHTQIVLCPGLNDGPELDRTIRELLPLHPSLLSIAIVPLGLTDHRKNLPDLEPASAEFCHRTIEQVERWQSRIASQSEEPILFLADEFYITAGIPAPDYSDSDVLHQLENGVGMVWEFMQPWAEIEASLPSSAPESRSVAIMTGALGARVIEPIANRLSAIEGLRVDVLQCENTLFGSSVTVSGLLGGADFLRTATENPGYDEYLIPGNALRAQDDRFLDDLTLAELEAKAPGPIRPLLGTAAELTETILEPIAV